MKELVAKEFLYFFTALIVAVPMAFLFVYWMDFKPRASLLSADERVLEMDLLLIGGLLGFAGVYVARFTVWAVKKVLIPNH